MKIGLTFAAVLTAMHFALADGSSGDFLKSPENSATSTSQVGTKTDLGKYDRGGWYCIGERGYARQEGVGLRKSSTGSLCYDFPEESPEFIATLTLTCSTASSTASKKEHTLDYALVTPSGEEVTGAYTFKTGIQGGIATTTVIFETPVETAGLRFSNPGTEIFELSEVEWTSALRPLEINYTAREQVNLEEAFDVSVTEVTGGTEVCTFLSVTFNGETVTYDNPTLPQTPVFVTPSVSGDCLLTILARDSAGTEKVVHETIQVLAYATPQHLSITNLTRTGFDLSWSMSSGATPLSYNFTVNEPRSDVEVIVVPDWQENSDGYWTSATAFDLTPWTDGFTVTTVYATPSVEVAGLEFSFDEGETWASKLFIGGKYLLSTLNASRQRVMVRTKGTRPNYLTFELIQIKSTSIKETIAATAQTPHIAVTDLRPGSTVTVTLTATFEDINGGDAKVKRSAEPISVTLPTLPGFTAVSALTKWSRLQLTWPSELTGLQGEVRLFAERTIPRDVPAGLYLSRVHWTKSGGGLSASKAIALTNMTARPIHLRGNYTLKAVNAKGTTRQWDFSTEDENAASAYPYVIPAGGELLFAHADYTPSDLRDEVVLADVSALNFTPDWTLSLFEGESLCNALAPQTNATVRLAQDSLETIEATPVTAAMPLLDALYTPWNETIEVRLIGVETFQQGSSSMMLSYAKYLSDLTTTRKIFAQCRTYDGSAYSQPLELLLWEPEARVGTRFLLR